MFIFQVELSEIFLCQFNPIKVQNNESLLDFIPTEDLNWENKVAHMNSPC